ncbi:glucosamine--fructose-6-phosphate aminotransferase [Babesia divergens]|uniref:glutamine--fructose-6-phosphate transaminase (isomerizing) n=1 Tax=Babesia divergens TaxID=32595 RepID=A0AAD9GFS7_BABDI|nr:glucosamine--fructose-6-phosphate aminotransferase [Babesia divergens]
MHFCSDVRRLIDSSLSRSRDNQAASPRGGTLTNALLQRLAFPNVFNKVASCCGVVAYVGEESCRDILLNGIQSIRHRGYDSCGISTLSSDGRIEVTKCSSYKAPANCFDRLRERIGDRHADSKIGIAHTRWATMGPPTDQNAHPHCDLKQRVALVHNGTVTNTVEVFNEMCEELRLRGLNPNEIYNTDLKCPDSDSGAIAYIIGLQLDLGADIFTAIKNVVSRLEGSWAICLVNANNPTSLYVARFGCPVLVIKDKETRSVLVASEAVAFMERSDDFVALEDGDVMELNYEKVDELYRTRTVLPITKQIIRSTPEPYEFWIQKEVVEQILVGRVALQHFKLINASRELKDIKQRLEGVVDVTFDSEADLVNRELELISAIDPLDVVFEIPVHGDASLHDGTVLHHNIQLIAAGSSGHATRYVANLFQRHATFNTIEADDPTELTLYRYDNPDSTFIYVSQSGETLDTVKACNYLSQRNPNAFKIAVVNNLNTLLDRSCDLIMMINIGREISLASTKAFTVEIMLLMALLGYILQVQDTEGKHADFLTDVKASILAFGNGIKTMLQKEDQYERIAQRLAKTQNVYIIGSGEGHAIALEGALKLKEVTYIFAEGIASGAMKHGHLASVDSKEATPVFVIAAIGDQVTINAARQLKSRGAYIILMSADPTLGENLADEFIQLPLCGMLTAACAIVPIQIVAYKISIIKGRNPDTPRGLAKTVTVT